MLSARLAAIAALLAAARAIFIELPPNEPVCFLRSVEAGEAVSIFYELNTPELMAGARRASSRPLPGALRVLDLQNQTVLDTPVVGKGSALFTPAEQGSYTVCFYSSGQRGQRGQRIRELDRLRFSFHGHSEKEREEEDKRRGAEELNVRKLITRAAVIRSQQAQVEKKYDAFGAKVSSSVRLVSVMSILVVLAYFGLTAWQVRTLKRYFARQKI